MKNNIIISLIGGNAKQKQMLAKLINVTISPLVKSIEVFKSDVKFNTSHYNSTSKTSVSILDGVGEESLDNWFVIEHIHSKGMHCMFSAQIEAEWYLKDIVRADNQKHYHIVTYFQHKINSSNK